jgi:hypothetical protein
MKLLLSQTLGLHGMDSGAWYYHIQRAAGLTVDAFAALRCIAGFGWRQL